MLADTTLIGRKVKHCLLGDVGVITAALKDHSYEITYGNGAKDYYPFPNKVCELI
jgi:hypothetical protein